MPKYTPLLALVGGLAAVACSSDTPKDMTADSGNKVAERDADVSDGGTAKNDATNGGKPAKDGGVTGDGAVADGSMINDAGGDGSTADCAITGAAAGTSYLKSFQSGSRIKARYVSAPGMPDTFIGFYDGTLGVACDFLPATDGSLRCLPQAAQSAINFGYIDANCKRVALQAPAHCATDNGYVRIVDDCGERYEIRQLEPLSSTKALYRVLSDACTDAAETLSPAATTFAAGTPLAPSTFALGTISTVPGACRAALRVVETADGASGPLELIDVGHSVRCARTSGTDRSACIPTQKAFLDPTLFEDSSCTTAGVYASWPQGPTCAPPDLIAGVGSAYDFYEVAGIHSGPLYSSPACELALNKPWIGTVFDLGAGIQKQELAQFDSAPVGSGRLQSYRMAESDVELVAGAPGLQIGSLYDTQLDKDCTVFRFTDGVYRCVPTNSLGSLDGLYYNDAACTQPIVLCYGSDCPGRTYVSRELDTAQCATDSPVNGVWQATTIGSGTYQDNGSGCQQFTVSGDDPWLADAVTLSTFATVELKVAN